METTIRRSVKKGKPHFFKILLRDFARKLWLPPRFVADHLGESPDKAVVHDAGGGAWDVALEKTAGGAFLSGGWAKFVEDHALQEHDLVVFQYDGGMHFTVILSFDRTACEKYAVSGGELRHGPDPVSPETEEEEDVKPSFDAARSPEIDPRKVAVPRRGTDRFAKNCAFRSEAKHSGRDISRKHRIRKETMRRNAAPFPFSSALPYFVSEMGRSQIVMPRIMRLPLAFSRAHTPASTITWMKLHDSDGNIWTVKYILSRGDAYFSAGWTAFVRDNNLHQGDYCAFELAAPVEFNITVIRADEVEAYRREKHTD